jgi:hypothetical protein
MTSTKKLLPQHVFLILGIVFMLLGLNNNGAFIAIGAAFIAIAAASTRHGKAKVHVSESDQ